MDRNRLTEVGKYLAYVLRHKPEEAKVTLDEQGWASVPDLLRYNTINMTSVEMLAVVDSDSKGRYSYNAEKLVIRANQGHSVKVDLLLKPVKPPAILYHGTSEGNFVKIIKAGRILSMSRHHVHLSDNLQTAKQVGERHGKLVVLEVDAEFMHQEGCQFYRSDNGVWLTKEVWTKYVEVVLDIK